MNSKRPYLATLILGLVLLLVLAAVVGFSFSATAQTGNTVYLPLVETGCDFMQKCLPTPTPRMWQPWGEAEAYP